MLLLCVWVGLLHAVAKECVSGDAVSPVAEVHGL